MRSYDRSLDLLRGACGRSGLGVPERSGALEMGRAWVLSPLGARRPATVSSARLSLRSLLPVVVAALAITWLVVSWGYIEDDAFIHIEFAQNLAHGRGFTFDGRHVYGDTHRRGCFCWPRSSAPGCRSPMRPRPRASGLIACAVGVARLGSVLLAKPAYRTAWGLFVRSIHSLCSGCLQGWRRWRPSDSAPGSWRQPWLRRFPVDGSRGSRRPGRRPGAAGPL